MNWTIAALALAGTVAAGAISATPEVASAQSPALLRLDGVGPLRLGMGPRAALRTGWLARRGRGCELGGPPIPVTYRLTGPRAPAGVVGVAEFRFGRLRNLSFSRGVRTATGVLAGRTTATEMVSRYRRAGFAARAQFAGVFQGTFVTVRRGGRQTIGGFARGRASARRPLSALAVPFVPTCE